jgi:hypothetical protein
MSRAFYRLINVPVRALLRSPLHGLMSRNTLLLEFSGRRSGRALSTPISYHERDGVLHAFTSAEFGWWRNLLQGQIHVVVRGRRLPVQAEVNASDDAEKARALDAFLRAVPRDAPHSGVALHADGTPDPDDILRVVPGMVQLTLRPLRP